MLQEFDEHLFSIAASKYINSFYIFSKQQNGYFQNIMIIVSKDHKITEGILIAHWDIFWTNPINITKNSTSLLFHLNYAFISKIVHCIPLGLGNVIISKAHVENVDLFKSKMNGFQFTKMLHFTMKKIKAGFYLQ